MLDSHCGDLWDNIFVIANISKIKKYDVTIVKIFALVSVKISHLKNGKLGMGPIDTALSVAAGIIIAVATIKFAPMFLEFFGEILSIVLYILTDQNFLIATAILLFLVILPRFPKRYYKYIIVTIIGIFGPIAMLFTVGWIFGLWK